MYYSKSNKNQEVYITLYFSTKYLQTFFHSQTALQYLYRVLSMTIPYTEEIKALKSPHNATTYIIFFLSFSK